MINIQGDSSLGKFNFFLYNFTQSVDISAFDSKIFEVQRPSITQLTLQIYRPEVLIKPFTKFDPGQGYIVKAKENFNIEGTASTFHLSSIELKGEQTTGKFNIVNFDVPETISVNNFNSDVFVIQKPSRSLLTLQVYTPEFLIKPFTTFESGSGYLIKGKQETFKVGVPEITEIVRRTDNTNNFDVSFTLNGLVCSSLTTESAATSTFDTGYAAATFNCTSPRIAFAQAALQVTTNNKIYFRVVRENTEPLFKAFSNIVEYEVPPVPPTSTPTPTQTPTETVTESTWNIGITTTGSNQTFGIQLNGTSPNIIVDWGDGTVNPFTTTGNKTRTYASAGNYTVKISGSFGANGNIRLGTTSAERARVQSTSVIPTIIELTSVQNSFFGCTSLTTIPAGLFANNTAITNFGFGLQGGCFTGCSSLTFIPAGLFDNNSNATDFISTFENCTSLITIPAGLFDNNLVVTNFSSCFKNCSSLTTVPSGLFANNTALLFGPDFDGVTLTTESYSNLLINMASNAASRFEPLAVRFRGGNSKFNSAGETARLTLINIGNFTFHDAGFDGIIEGEFTSSFIPFNIVYDSQNQTYSFSQFATTNPLLTCYRGVNYDFIPIGEAYNNFSIKRIPPDQTELIDGFYNRNIENGKTIGDRMLFTPVSTTPDQIMYVHETIPSLSGIITIKDSYD